MVTVDGTPANSGQVTFTGAKGSISGTIQPDGKYKAVGVPVGAVKVAVVPPPKLPSAAPPIEGTAGTGAVGPPVPIPAKYADVNSSGLSTTLKAGTNTYNIDLTAK